MRAAIYARYSAGPRQTDQSIEGQIRDCTDFCQQKGYTVVETYADRHISGKTDDRPEFQRLIADSKKKKFEAVVVWKTDRFARNKYDSAIYKRQLRMNGIQIFYAKEAIPEGPEGIILESLMEGLAEYYSAELAQKIRRGMRESALKCKILGNSIPLGYRASPERTYELDPDAAKTVQTIFEMYLEENSNAEICDYLNSLGYKTSRGNSFNKNSINRIIKNEKYIGIYKAGDVTIEGGVPEIVSKETFYLAQKEMAKRATSKTTRKTTADYMLAGKLFCGYCKKAMVGVSGTSHTGKKHCYYYCPDSRAKRGCEKKPVAKDYIEDLVVQATVDYILKPEVIESLTHKLYLLQASEDTRDEDIAHFKKKLTENKKAIENILTAIETGLGTTTLLERLQRLESEQTAIEGELAYCKTRPFGKTESELQFFLEQYLRDPAEGWDAYKRKIIKHFIAEVFLFDDKLLIDYNIGNGQEHASETVMLAEADSSTSDSASPLWVLWLSFFHIFASDKRFCHKIINAAILLYMYKCNNRHMTGGTEMENSNEKKSKQYRVGEHIFYSENEARLAGLEQKKIDYLKSKMDYSRPESILKVYDKAISEQLFKTPVGLEFLSELHIFLTGCSDISDKDIQALPLQKGSKVVRGDNVSAGRRANTPGKKSGDSGSRALFISVMLNIVLVIAVLAMFFITLNSEQPNILNYENVITNRYASWEQQLTERENAVREKERELNIETE